MQVIYFEVSTIALGLVEALCPSIFIVHGGHNYPHFTDRKMRTQRGE